MKVYQMNENAIIPSLSVKKKRILTILKQEIEIDLKKLAEILGITKMGVLNHVKELEELGIIERIERKSGVGRPRLFLKLSKNSTNIFPRAYSKLTCSMLQFIKEKLGPEGVFEALKNRQSQILEEYKFLFNKNHITKLTHKIEQLAKIRDQEGYMVKLKSINENSFEFLEYNCPIIDVAEKFQQSCIVEKELFEELLDANVEITHRNVNGDSVCRFIIKGE